MSTSDTHKSARARTEEGEKVWMGTDGLVGRYDSMLASEGENE